MTKNTISRRDFAAATTGALSLLGSITPLDAAATDSPQRRAFRAL